MRRANSFFTGVFLSLQIAAAAFAGGPIVDPAKATRDEAAGIAWYDLKLLNVEGRGWTDTPAFFDRLPAKAQPVVPESVWGLSRHSTGLCARFVTDSPTIHVRWTLTSAKLEMPHMPATGVSGVDLYVKQDGKWRWLAIGFPKEQTSTTQLVGGLATVEREYLLYLPLYNGVSSVEIGLPARSPLAQADAYPAGHEKPIVFYGTSITQGGCASRPGMVHTAILGRRLNYPVINLGFSGSGRMEPAMGNLFAELDPAVYVLDCLPNMGAGEVRERVEPFVATVRKAHPRTPILLVEDRSYSDSFLVESKQKRNTDCRAELRAAYDRLKTAGVPELYYLTGDHLLGEDNEGTVDSSHPTDLGFMRQADAFEAALRPILKSVKGQ
ncbi:MAG: SGNH/GDSL hydrolase family protein [Planctomycetota bacterium]|nr:SGNH/GDSL hydrolase family protein [Planctomycetota bacterium]